MKSNRAVLSLLVLAMLLFTPGLFAQDEKAASDETTAEGLVRKLYDLVTWEAGTLPNWDDIKALFLKEAVILLRQSPVALKQMDVQGFIDLWLVDVEKYKLKDTGFEEKILKIHVRVNGDIAHAWVLYAPRIPGRQGPQIKGIDSFQMVKQGERWWFVSITNEVVRPGVPIPEELK